MTNESAPSARLLEARAGLSAILERLMIDDVATDYRRGRDPTKNLERLVKHQELKRKMGIQGRTPG